MNAENADFTKFCFEQWQSGTVVGTVPEFLADGYILPTVLLPTTPYYRFSGSRYEPATPGVATIPLAGHMSNYVQD